MIFAAAALLLILQHTLLRLIEDIDEGVSAFISEEVWQDGFGTFSLKTAQTIQTPGNPV